MQMGLSLSLSSGKNYICHVTLSLLGLLFFFFMTGFNFGGFYICIIGLGMMNSKNHRASVL